MKGLARGPRLVCRNPPTTKRRQLCCFRDRISALCHALGATASAFWVPARWRQWVRHGPGLPKWPLASAARDVGRAADSHRV